MLRLLSWFAQFIWNFLKRLFIITVLKELQGEGWVQHFSSILHLNKKLQSLLKTWTVLTEKSNINHMGSMIAEQIFYCIINLPETTTKRSSISPLLLVGILKLPSLPSLFPEQSHCIQHCHKFCLSMMFLPYAVKTCRSDEKKSHKNWSHLKKSRWTRGTQWPPLYSRIKRNWSAAIMWSKGKAA